MRFTMKPGVSDATTGTLPQRSTNTRLASSTARSVASAGITSTSAISGAGLKKWTPTTRSARSQPPAIAAMLRLEVFVARTASRATTDSSARNSVCLIVRSSTIASITRPQSLNAASSLGPTPFT